MSQTKFMAATGCVCVSVIGIWQWFRRITFSVIRPKSIHHKRESETKSVNPSMAMAWGKRWRNASPKSAPAEKLTSNNNIFLRNLVLNHKVIIPINEIALTISTLTIAYKKAITLHYKIKRKHKIRKVVLVPFLLCIHLVPNLYNFSSYSSIKMYQCLINNGITLLSKVR